MAPTQSGNFGLVAAAGRSVRFRGTRKGRTLKQFAPLCGMPVLAWSLVAFERSGLTQAVVVVTGKNEVASVRRLVTRLRFRKVSGVAVGGKLRADSVRRGLALLPADGYVAIHDAARPLVTSRMIDEGFMLCRRGPAAYGAPLTDTIKRVIRARIVSTVPREGLFAVQTPQFFPLRLIRRAHEEAVRRRLALTDDCAAVELLGYQPLVIPALEADIKITTASDLKLAESVLQQRKDSCPRPCPSLSVRVPAKGRR